MVELKIVKITKYNEYILQEDKNKHSLALEFYNMPQPQVGDILLAPKEILDTKSLNYVHFLCFMPLKEGDKPLRETDTFGLHTKNKNYVLKRVYG